MHIKLACCTLFFASLLGAQTAAELLQKGIYNQETAGNLDEAISTYRQILSGAFPQRELAAQAQYRLAQALLQKGDLAGASREFEVLARNYSEYKDQIAALGRGNGTVVAHVTYTPNSAIAEKMRQL